MHIGPIHPVTVLPTLSKVSTHTFKVFLEFLKR
uniref:Uncharacterized protein n=1 Tax=Anguilla anguilla TaxID=7936 RepID=A0A0E9W2K3_ANGAN